MILTKDESICLVLSLSENNIVSSTTKLNKLLARLNLFFIPIDINFSLNKYGSFNSDLKQLEPNENFDIETYCVNETDCHKYILKEKWKEKVEVELKKKLKTIMADEELNELKEEIYSLSQLNANDISDNEHKKLLVDVEDRFKLEQRINEVLVELTDLYNDSQSIDENSIVNIRLKALIEYCFYLVRFLKEKWLKRLPNTYDFDDNMFHYYFLFNIYHIIPFLKEQITLDAKNSLKINRYYQYLINSVRDNYSFSIYNENLNKLIVK